MEKIRFKSRVKSEMVGGESGDDNSGYVKHRVARMCCRLSRDMLME